MTYKYCQFCDYPMNEPSLYHIQTNEHCCPKCGEDTGFIEDRIALLCEYIENLENKLKELLPLENFN